MLSEDAEEWFYLLPTVSITTWEQIEKTFLDDYFLASVYIRKRYEIVSFKQKEGDSLGDAYKRFKRLLVASPMHNMSQIEQMHMFVNDLQIKTTQLIDTGAGGSSNFTTATGVKKIIEAIAANEHLELYDIFVSKSEGVIDLKLEVNKKLKIKEVIIVEVEKKMKAMNMGTQKEAQVQQAHKAGCECCSGPHMTVHCLATP